MEIIDSKVTSDRFCLADSVNLTKITNKRVENVLLIMKYSIGKKMGKQVHIMLGYQVILNKRSSCLPDYYTVIQQLKEHA